MALVTLAVTTPAFTAMRSIMELPLFERAVLIIKKFETLHKPKHWPYYHKLWISLMLAMVIKSSRANLTVEAVSSPRHRLTHCTAKTSLSSAPFTPNTAKTQFFSAYSPTTASPV